MEVKIVLGMLWGDEGKGNTVQWLCKKALSEGKKPCVIRFSGGPQSGHTVRHNGVTHICSSFGSGVLLDVPTYYLNTALIDPLCVKNERDILMKKGVKAPQIFAYPNCCLITPYDVQHQIQWSKNNPNRTCGKGIMSALSRENIVRYENICDRNFEKRLKLVGELYRNNVNVPSDILEEWKAAAHELYESVEKNLDTPDIDVHDVLIFEGTQGLLLDVENGFYPYTTSTKVGLNGIPAHYLKEAEVYLVSRTYLTRHGIGPEYEKRLFNGRKPIIPVGKLETNVLNEFQGEFKTARLTSAPYYYAIHRHCLDNWQKRYNLKFNLAITHTDCSDDSILATMTIKSYISDAIQISSIYTSDNPDSDFRLFQ